MEYLIYRKNIPSQFINLELTLHCKKGETVQLQLPSWRPGRYEVANYAQKTRQLKVIEKNREISAQKITKDLWHFTAGHSGPHVIQYEYHASQMDAGGSWSDDEQLYLNFINFIFEVKGREEESIKVKLDIPGNYTVATALPLIGPLVLEAKGFQHLVDSPLIASSTLQHHHYESGGCLFHLWFQGAIHFEIDQLKEHFKNFTEKQIEAFDDFPAPAYHFLFQLLPYNHYHGVEHQFSTVITLGPAKELENETFMDQLIGVSSHELYHFWNVCRIRPKKLLPYDFSKEAYIDTGVVAEGVTTYMGDLFLLKSGYLSLEAYLKKLEKLINRETEHFGWQNHSITESSFDLWLDGYKPGIPDRKVSIYNRGALISFCLDLTLIDHGSSLHEVMKMMWINFGKKGIGYSLDDYQTLVGQSLNDRKATEKFFQRYIFGKEDILPLIKTQLASLGIKLHENNRNEMESCFGLVIDSINTVRSIHPESPAYEHLMIGDIISHKDIPENQNKYTLNITVRRNERVLGFVLENQGSIYYKNYTLLQKGSPEKLSQWKA
ncbi:MAG: M61 family peptidase [Anditalea sp.]